MSSAIGLKTWSKRDVPNFSLRAAYDFESHWSASNESFKAIAEKYMPHTVDLENNHRLDWFFREWVYGTEVPHYEFEYQTSPGSEGKTKVHSSIAQSQVSENFVMLVPIFGDFGKGFVRLGQLPVVGNVTKKYDFEFSDAPQKIELNTFKETLVR